MNHPNEPRPIPRLNPLSLAIPRLDVTDPHVVDVVFTALQIHEGRPDAAPLECSCGWTYTPGDDRPNGDDQYRSHRAGKIVRGLRVYAEESAKLRLYDAIVNEPVVDTKEGSNINRLAADIRRFTAYDVAGEWFYSGRRGCDDDSESLARDLDALGWTGGGDA